MISPVSAPKDRTLYLPSNMTSLVSQMAIEFPNSGYRFVLFISTNPASPCGPGCP